MSDRSKTPDRYIAYRDSYGGWHAAMLEEDEGELPSPFYESAGEAIAACWAHRDKTAAEGAQQERARWEKGLHELRRKFFKLAESASNPEEEGEYTDRAIGLSNLHVYMAGAHTQGDSDE